MNHYLSDAFTAFGWFITIVFLLLSLPATNKEWKDLFSVKFIVFMFVFVGAVYTIRDTLNELILKLN